MSSWGLHIVHAWYAWNKMHLHVASPIYFIQFYFIFVLVSIFLVNKLKVVLSTIFFFFGSKGFHQVSLFHSCYFLHIWFTYICSGFYTKKYRILFHTIKCKYISLDVGIELSIWEGNGHVFSCLVLKPVLF